MKDFTLKTINNTDILKELENIGFDKTYSNIAQNKYKYLNIKIFNLSIPQANILKQTALSCGSDCALHKAVLVNEIEKTDCILTGSISQLKKISKSLEHQQFSLNILSKKIEELISKQEEKPTTKLVGILNITTNSFSDGGKYLDKEDAIKHLNQMIEEGADIIDIGAESTKPYSEPIDAETQLTRILPILKYIKTNNIKTPISIDTRCSEVAKKCVENGATIINDVSGFDYDEKMIEVIKNSNAKIILQHSKGTPENMQINPTYDNVVDEIYKNLKEKIDYATSNGIEKSRIIIDVGIGFGKRKEDNFELIKRMSEFKSLGCEIMAGISRKSFLELEDTLEKDIYTTALSTMLIEQKIDYLRVHNVKMHKKLLDLMKNFGE